MPTYPCPIPLPDFQTYLKDASIDPTVLAFFQECLDTATDYVYDWLDRDYTPSATKTDIFWGDDTLFYAPSHQCGQLLSWSYTDLAGTTTTPSIADLLIRSNGYMIQAVQERFHCGAEHTITYKQPTTLACPETVKQVIVEIAAMLFLKSNQGEGSLGLDLASSRTASTSSRERYGDLSERHKEMLRPYKRYPV